MNKSKLFGFLALLLIAAVLFGIGYFTQRKDQKEEGHKVETKATITQIDEIYDPDDESTDHKVYVSYKADGTEYEEELRVWQSGYYVGKEIDIYYLDNDPTQIDIPGSNKNVTTITYIMGGVFAVAALAVLFVRTKRTA